jgi:hypothetical protein
MQAVAHIARVAQRMCNQNMQQDIIADFKVIASPLPRAPRPQLTDSATWILF